MNTTDLHIYQSVESGGMIVLVAVIILVVGYGFYRRMKLSEKD